MAITQEQRAAARAKLEAGRAARLAVLEELIANGVNVVGEEIYVEPTVRVAAGATLLPGTILRGETVVEEGCVPRFTGGFELLRPQEGGAVPGAAGAPDEKDSHA